MANRVKAPKTTAGIRDFIRFQVSGFGYQSGAFYSVAIYNRALSVASRSRFVSFATFVVLGVGVCCFAVGLLVQLVIAVLAATECRSRGRRAAAARALEPP